jgi:UDP-N-acetylmuramate: L-alanyl-gamma-D-glutamyl-meso-diaminopimelate ligase
MFPEIRSVHFVGICGTAMASAAAAMQEKGFQVTGSDQNVYPPMSTFLAERKIGVFPGYAERNLVHMPGRLVATDSLKPQVLHSAGVEARCWSGIPAPMAKGG